MIALILFMMVQLASPGTARDKETGLILEKGWELVRDHCTHCHSGAQITRQRGNRKMWLDSIRWMQKTQGMWELEPAVEMAILDYLEKNYAPSERSRRAPIPLSLLPPNPYRSLQD